MDNQGHRFESKQHRSKSAFAELLMKPMCIRNLLHRFPLSNSCNAEAVWCFRPMQNNPSPTSRCCPVSKRRPRLTIEPLMSPCISQPPATFPRSPQNTPCCALTSFQLARQVLCRHRHSLRVVTAQVEFEYTHKQNTHATR